MTDARTLALIEIQTGLKEDGYYTLRLDGAWGPGSRSGFAAMRQDAAIGRNGIVPAKGAVEKGKPLTEADYRAAAAALTVAAGRTVTVKQVKVIKAVESGGAWFTDIRADILAADGNPYGGFIDGDMPKILFEAKEFHKRTSGRYDASHPNISSPVWNRSLYVGGQGEYLRLAKAMTLSENAALESASVGMFQIMAYHWRALGYASVQDFWDRMKRSEGEQLDAFVRFVKVNGLADELSRGNNQASSWIPFVQRYNGPGYAQNRYHIKAAEEFARLS